MFNVTVLRMKDIAKGFMGIMIVILVIILASKYIPKTTNNEEKVVKEIKGGIETLSESALLGCLDQTIPTIATLNEEYNNIAKEDDKVKSVDMLHEMINTQISTIKGIEVSENRTEDVSTAEQNNSQQNKGEQKDEKNKNEIQLAQGGLATQVVTQNPIKESFNIQHQNVKIKNETSYELTEEMMTPDITIENKNILLFHTHSCESYTSSEAYPYTQTGNFRTTDLNYTVTRVGTELENQLKQYNYNVIHSTDYHDYPAYNGSYTRSLATVENLLKTTQADIIMDVHRDAIGSRSDYAPCVKIGETDVAAQIMFVIGTNGGGLWHPNWNQNLKFAIKIQQKAEEMYPGLFKPIMLTNSRYNQHTGKYASIIEVGATGNTLDQCLTSMKYLAKVMDEIMK